LNPKFLEAEEMRLLAVRTMAEQTIQKNERGRISLLKKEVITKIHPVHNLLPVLPRKTDNSFKRTVGFTKLSKKEKRDYIVELRKDTSNREPPVLYPDSLPAAFPFAKDNPVIRKNHVCREILNSSWEFITHESEPEVVIYDGMQLLFRNAGTGAQTLEEYCDNFLNRFIFQLGKGGIRIFALVFDMHCY
jgi:hypothetical protein